MCVWKQVIVLGLPACPTTSTAWLTRTETDSSLSSSSKVMSIRGWKGRSVRGRFLLLSGGEHYGNVVSFCVLFRFMASYLFVVLSTVSSLPCVPYRLNGLL